MGEQTVSFYVPGPQDLTTLTRLDVDRDWRWFGSGLHSWVVQTYLHLHRRGCAVRLTDTVPEDGGILVLHARSLPAAEAVGLPSGLAVVVIRADKPAQHRADFEIVQNGFFADDRRIFSVPFWPQPGLLPRDPTRAPLLRRAAFKGHVKTLNPDLRSRAWLGFLRARGIEWECDDAPFRGPGAVYEDVHWNDYREVDAIVAVRPDWSDRHLTKPASKLVNAWLAGVPAILGPEHAYQELRRSPLDYLEVTSLAATRAAVEALATGGARYEEMVANGRERASAFTIDAIASRWVDVLFGAVPAAMRSRRFTAAPRVRRTVASAVRGIRSHVRPPRRPPAQH